MDVDVNVNLVIDCSDKWCTLQAGRKECCVHVTEWIDPKHA